MAFIIRKDNPGRLHSPPLFAEKLYGLTTYKRPTVISFVRDRALAFRFEDRQAAERIAATFNVGSSRLSVEPE
jgi:hypothetical protein